jgi:hypothetical protein
MISSSADFLDFSIGLATELYVARAPEERATEMARFCHCAARKETAPSAIARPRRKPSRQLA